MKRFFVGTLFVLVGLGGCKQANDGAALPDRPPPANPPKLAMNPAYRPHFQFGNKTSAAGTAFLLKAPSGKLVALTAQHLLDASEWGSIESTSSHELNGPVVIQLTPRPHYIGKSFDELPTLESGATPLFDTLQDFAIWILPKDTKATPLELAANDPQVNEWVWIVGAEANQPMKFYRGQITRIHKGTYMLKPHDHFKPIGFSGGPVLNADGKVVGTVLAADQQGTFVQGAAASNIRTRIEYY